MTTRTQLGLIIAGLFMASAAQASVIYDWLPETGVAHDGAIVMTDAAYQSGHIDALYDSYDAPLSGFADSSIIEAGLFITDVAGAFAEPRRADYFGLSKALDADLQINSNGTLDGSLNIHGHDEQFKSTSNGSGLWAVTEARGVDFRPPCQGSYASPCAGTGSWVLRESTVPNDVPSPPAWGLFGLAAALTGLAGWIRRRRLN